MYNPTHTHNLCGILDACLPLHRLRGRAPPEAVHCRDQAKTGVPYSLQRNYRKD